MCTGFSRWQATKPLALIAVGLLDHCGRDQRIYRGCPIPLFPDCCGGGSICWVLSASKRAQVGNVLQRRHDLIPNLIALTKASAAHEKELLTSLVRLEEKSAKAKSFGEKQAAEAALGAAAREVLVKLRADPSISATGVFARLSDGMAGAENRIAVERKRYNEAVFAYNRSAGSFPVLLLRPLLGFPWNEPYIQVSAQAKKAPEFQ